ncbi:uncharacterized protein LY79DRAFT_662934 [Colletotrichum navitas]|uniref:Uncharacterized protein n=1 Tax=Colletotrichum navitas TaxID=681940 RepID=A0AAD8PNS5_9PEZI|nr:uncharacterized protein LY79DRAFT_662934 [Colletotrichum navitas]KAK1573183.1 hypothetical protein LY79DRAFT_662934 [Colletotrichum navitas]
MVLLPSQCRLMMTILHTNHLVPTETLGVRGATRPDNGSRPASPMELTLTVVISCTKHKGRLTGTAMNNRTKSKHEGLSFLVGLKRQKYQEPALSSSSYKSTKAAIQLTQNCRGLSQNNINRDRSMKQSRAAGLPLTRSYTTKGLTEPAPATARNNIVKSREELGNLP